MVANDTFAKTEYSSIKCNVGSNSDNQPSPAYYRSTPANERGSRHIRCRRWPIGGRREKSDHIRKSPPLRITFDQTSVFGENTVKEWKLDGGRFKLRPTNTMGWHAQRRLRVLGEGGRDDVDNNNNNNNVTFLADSSPETAAAAAVPPATGWGGTGPMLRLPSSRARRSSAS